MAWELVVDDMREALARLEPDSFDSCITDPPYELGFMGKAWDSSGIAFDPETWRAVYRVLKPGAHLLAFGGTRTIHRITCAIEDAGFEIRDQLAWIYGTGFPKSLNVSEQIDKTRDDEEDVRVVCRAIRARMTENGVTAKKLAKHFGFHPRMIDHWAARDTDSQPTLPTLAQWYELKPLIGMGDELDAEVARLNARKGEWGEAFQEAEIVGEKPPLNMGFGPEHRFTRREEVQRAPNSEEARRWLGWGTGLRPSIEPICLARKPLAGRVVDTVLSYGTGALNIDASRLERDDTETDGWPANVLLDEDAAAALEEQAPGSSRFFYVAKPDRAERDAGCDALPVVTGGEATGRKDGSAGTKNPRAGAGRGGGARNIHPTVKPVDLGRYLATLVTPPGGRILEPFVGSAGLACGAVAAGFDVFAVELETPHAVIAHERLRWWSGRTLNPRGRARPAKPVPAQVDLFGA